MHVFLFTFFIFILVAASVPHFLTAAKKFSRFSSKEIGPRCFFIPRSGSFSSFHFNVDIKI